MITAGLILAALAACAFAGLLALVLPPAWHRVHRSTYLILAAAAVLLAVAGARADLGRPGVLQLGQVLGFGSSSLRADPLAGLFLSVTGVVAAPVLLGFAAWSRRSADVPFRQLPALVALTLAGIVVVLLADSAYLFLFGWESVSVGFFLLSGYRRDRAGTGRAAMLTFAFSKASGSVLLVAFLLLAAATGSFQISDWGAAHGAARDAAYALALLGFTAKVGVVPLQVWVPSGYAAAPGPARALMSAVAANIGFYGMWRMLAVLGRPPTWVVVALLIAAGFTALLGIAHAAVQRELPRVVAYSSVENGGLITAGYAVGLAGSAAGMPRLVALGLLTSALQMIAHALAKSGLFLATARLEQLAGVGDLDLLQAAGRREPVTGTAFVLSAATLAGLPLTVGFVSEWFLLEAVMQLFRVQQLAVQLTLALTGAALALAIGVAGFTFVRLVGMVALGPRTPRRAGPELPPLGGLGAIALLVPALGCVVLAAVTPLEIRFLAHGLSPVVPATGPVEALAAPWVLQPVYRDFSVLSPSWLAIALPVLAAAVLGFAALASRWSMFQVRRVPAWRSASGGVAGDGRYTTFAFANPTRHVLGNLLLTQAGHVELERRSQHEEQTATALHGPDLPEAALASAPPVRQGEGAPSGHHHASYSTDVVEFVETYLYRPLLRPLRAVVSAAKRLQSGRLDAYISYMLVVLLALIAVVLAAS